MFRFSRYSGFLSPLAGVWFNSHDVSTRIDCIDCMCLKIPPTCNKGMATIWCRARTQIEAYLVQSSIIHHMQGVTEVERVNRGRTTSRNGRASRCHHCYMLQRTGVDGRPSQGRHLSWYPNDAWSSRVLIDWLMQVISDFWWNTLTHWGMHQLMNK